MQSPEIFFVSRKPPNGYMASITVGGIHEKHFFSSATAEDMVESVDAVLEDTCDLAIDNALKNAIIELFDRCINDIAQVEPGKYVIRCAIDRHIGVMHTIVDSEGMQEIAFPNPNTPQPTL